MAGQNRFATSIQDYELLETIGNGSFGEVKLGRHKSTGVKVAIKIQTLNKNSKEENVREEVKIMKLRLMHPCIVRCYDVIETQSQIYMIIELCESGELFDYMMKKPYKLQEDEARKFFQQIILAIEYCHANMVVHGDLKLENILLDAHHQVKIIDFGLGHIIKDDERLTALCGSLHYAAPEVLSRIPYDGRKVDVWSCGIILYVLLCRMFPFDNQDGTITFQMIKAGKYSIPSHLSAGAKDLIQRILVVDPMKRISIAQIRQHPWFQPHLPSFLALPPLHRTQQLIDKGILEEVAKMGIDMNQLIQSLTNKVHNKETVAYYLLYDSFFRVTRGSLGGDTTKVNVMHSGGASSSASGKKLQAEQDDKITTDINLIPPQQHLHGSSFTSNVSSSNITRKRTWSMLQKLFRGLKKKKP